MIYGSRACATVTPISSSRRPYEQVQCRRCPRPRHARQQAADARASTSSIVVGETGVHRVREWLRHRRVLRRNSARAARYFDYRRRSCRSLVVSSTLTVQSRVRAIGREIPPPSEALMRRLSLVILASARARERLCFSPGSCKPKAAMSVCRNRSWSEQGCQFRILRCSPRARPGRLRRQDAIATLLNT